LNVDRGSPNNNNINSTHLPDFNSFFL